MFLATYSIAVVGVGRLVGQTGFESAVVWPPLNLAPVLSAIAYDILVWRKIYAVMVLGLVVHLFRLNADPFADSGLWLPVGRAVWSSALFCRRRTELGASSRVTASTGGTINHEWTPAGLFVTIHLDREKLSQ